MKSIGLRFVIIALAFIAATVVIKRAGAQAVPAGSDDKPVEQVQKNIKVLTGMPQSQLIPVMNYFSASMGRRCNFCHVNNQGQWDYASDAKPEKDQAREMIKMVIDINKNYFKGNREVACYTCHRGVNHPMSIPALPIPRPSPPSGGGAPGSNTPGAQAQASPTPRPSPPAADAIINKYVEASGGQAAIDKLKSRIMKGTVALANGITGTYEALQSMDKGYEMFTTSSGSLERAVTGTSGWETTRQGIHVLTGQQLADAKSQMILLSSLKLKDQYASFRFAGRDKINEQNVVIILGTTADQKRERLFFDADSGLLLRRISYLDTIIGIIPQQIDFEDYRDVDGVKLPFTIRVSSTDAGNPFIVRTVTEIKLNGPVDESKFNAPPAKKP